MAYAGTKELRINANTENVDKAHTMGDVDAAAAAVLQPEHPGDGKINRFFFKIINCHHTVINSEGIFK